MRWTDLGGTFAAMSLLVAARYLVVAAAAYALLWRRGPRRALRLNRRAPDWAQMRGEIALSLVSSAIFAAPAAFALEAWKHGGTRLFDDLTPRAWPLIALTTAAAVVANDAFYFWAHRLMHRRPLFRLFHAGHHRHPEPSPFAAFAFDPLEAAATGWVLPALAFVMPIEAHAAVAVLMGSTVLATVNHAGWEVWPRGWVRGAFGRWVITPSHHAQHHTRFGCNFGLYFTLWDRLCGVNSPADAHAAWRAGEVAGSLGRQPSSGRRSGASAARGSPEPHGGMLALGSSRPGRKAAAVVPATPRH
jgi:Delta7-sterol 5-desaturase